MQHYPKRYAKFFEGWTFTFASSAYSVCVRDENGAWVGTYKLKKAWRLSPEQCAEIIAAREEREAEPCPRKP